MGIQRVEHVAAHPMRGALFENLVVMELMKNRFNRGKTDNLYFLRDRKGNEVDVLLDYGSYIDLVEIKSGRTLTGDFFTGIDHFRELYEETRNCFLIYGGDQARTQEGVVTIPWKNIPELDIE